MRMDDEGWMNGTVGTWCSDVIIYICALIYICAQTTDGIMKISFITRQCRFSCVAVAINNNQYE